MKLLLNRKWLLFVIPYLILHQLTAHNSLFWDTMQFAGDHPNWYWDHNFRYLLLPDSCDSGHPPAFGMYIALAWKAFGRSLWVSHMAMLPFVILLVTQAVRAGEVLFPADKRFAFYTTLVLLTESALMTQCTLVSPDVWLLAFFLLAFNAIMRNARLQLMLAVMVMGVLSTRAMMASVTLYLFALALRRREAVPGAGGMLRYLLRTVWPFLPGAFLAIAYFTWHYLAKGWVGYPRNSPWAPGFQIVPLPRIALNLLILGWRFVDLGKVGTVTVFVILLIRWLRKKILFADVERRWLAGAMLLWVLALLCITALPLALYQGLLTHRYFLPLSVAISLLAMLLLQQAQVRRKGIWVLCMVLVQLSGHFWTYPRQVSQGWEGMLGHLYFYNMRRDFREYMRLHGITKDQVASSSTLMQSDKRIDLGTDTTTFRSFDTDSTEYVWYCNVSNVMNKSVDYYFRNFDIVKREKKGHVEMVLFRRRNQSVKDTIQHP